MYEAKIDRTTRKKVEESTTTLGDFLIHSLNTFSKQNKSEGIENLRMQLVSMS